MLKKLGIATFLFLLLSVAVAANVGVKGDSPTLREIKNLKREGRPVSGALWHAA